MAAAAAKDFRARASVIKISHEQPSYPKGLTEMNGNLYYLGGNQVFQMDTTTGEQTILAGNSLGGHADGPLLSAGFRFDYYSDMTCLNGDLYVTDYKNNSVRKITLDRAGVPGQVTTLIGFNRENESNNAILSYPNLITSSANDLYVLEAPSQSLRIRRIDMRSNRVTTLRLINSTGIEGYLERCHPIDMVANETDIYLSTSDNIILKVNLSSMNVSVLAGEYRRDGDNDGARLDARFHQLLGLAIIRNNLYVADYDKIRVISLTEDRVTTLVALKEGTEAVLKYETLEFMTASSRGDVLFVSDDREAYWKAIKIDLNPHDRNRALFSLLRAQPWLKSRRNKKSSRQKKTRKTRQI